VLWEENGRPSGRDEEFWYQAEGEYREAEYVAIHADEDAAASARTDTTRTSIRPTAIAALSGGAFVMSVSAAGEVFLAGNDSKSSKLFRRAVDGSMACTASIKLGRPNEPTGLCL
jgi:DUF2934 family protein